MAETEASKTSLKDSQKQGEIIESLLHITIHRMNLECSIFKLNHYVTGLILFGKGKKSEGIIFQGSCI
ncbi:hypothetical protein ATANTOWER_029535 [Ataeniobius toweri]|uniref:Uncharacterized protein n=1 Tax=Ataeniobius toweri TaxID=208326 RepID=A0ABU7AJG4_9TELE|nr:hypothetical protein [Ataeniobius toweri]